MPSAGSRLGSGSSWRAPTVGEPSGPSTGTPPGRLLGLDLGDARIGVAVSDPDGRVAVPVGTVRVGQPPGELKAIRALVAEHGAVGVILGHPRSMSGASGSRAAHAEAFADALRSVVDVPVELQDERLTTVEAERSLRDAGVDGRTRREVVDQTAAAVILQAWLDAHRR
jgi:putative Holliday junction resolvase